jgi:hypothetical protein
MIQTITLGGTAPAEELLSFRATNITGTRELPLEVRRDLSVSDVTNSLAEMMGLPDDVAWALRADRGEFLDESRSIGESLEPGANVTLTPRTHLG